MESCWGSLANVDETVKSVGAEDLRFIEHLNRSSSITAISESLLETISIIWFIILSSTFTSSSVFGSSERKILTILKYIYKLFKSLICYTQCSVCTLK